jgi:hypothetical protein
MIIASRLDELTMGLGQDVQRNDSLIICTFKYRSSGSIVFVELNFLPLYIKAPHIRHFIENGAMIRTFCDLGPASLFPRLRVRAEGSKSGG